MAVWKTHWRQAHNLIQQYPQQLSLLLMLPLSVPHHLDAILHQFTAILVYGKSSCLTKNLLKNSALVWVLAVLKH